ncbi:hypothetical protein DS2_10427 [Catenovulum agarivorans DS-2]|uniref:Phage protein n=1 Tax=Catenovulum agarivorans DS-2 TaxID=1328313 RepID=W7QLP2_9ALTE|nr:hypothetical protein [Catenovulum agarivorans]EWH09857.1 hypothetical protein DS2_10427 [Catenovulum agarivorans DS-2]
MPAKRLSGKRAYPVKAGAVLTGNRPVLLAAGLAIAVTDNNSALSAGVATMLADNANGADSAIMVEVDTGEHKFVSADITIDDVGSDAYFVDDLNVSIDSDTDGRAKAGKITQVDSDGVWVELGV